MPQSNFTENAIGQAHGSAGANGEAQRQDQEVVAVAEAQPRQAAAEAQALQAAAQALQAAAEAQARQTAAEAQPRQINWVAIVATAALFVTIIGAAITGTSSIKDDIAEMSAEVAEVGAKVDADTDAIRDVRNDIRQVRNDVKANGESIAHLNGRLDELRDPKR